ncbi:MAG: DUF1295 domain-containing protein [Spirochaetes bacterium]|nr:DUF1295 domain-containing protein [Spirochaetota bacterium]
MVCIWMATGFALASFVAGWVSGDYSWIDRLWSTLPVGFVWYYAARADFEWRSLLVAGLVTLWGARLTFNFARKGGYGKTEDYRWAYMRSVIPNPVLWQAFNLLFICAYQAGMFVLFTLPAFVLWEHRGRSFQWLDALAILLFLAFLAIETVADQQQWAFQERKRRGERGSGDLERGFLASGLFRFSRHPNFFGEMGIWWAVYLFSVSVTGAWFLNVGILGAVMLTLLFQGSTGLTEKLSKKKYPAYGEYQKRTSRLIPWFSKGMGEKAS